MNVARRVLVSTFTLAALIIAPPGRGEEPRNPRPLADKAIVVAGPTEAFRYSQGEGFYGPPTKTLLARGRRAFFPGESVDLSFRLPDDARLATPVEVRVRFALHDLDGVEIEAAGETTLKVADAGVEGAIPWRVPDAPEGRYFLAARFFGPDETLLVTRSEVVFLTPEYPRLLAAAEEALSDLERRADRLTATQRAVSVPSTEMLVEDAVMRWEDFGHAPRDWDYVRTQLEAATAYAKRLASGDDPWRHRKGAFVRGYRSEIDDTLQPYAVYVPDSYDPARSYPMLVMLHGATSNHLLARRRVFFATISPVCAVGDVSLFPYLAGASEADRELLALTSPSAIAENALNQTLFIFHGDEDPAVDVSHSRRMVEIYRELGWLDKSVFYFELPGVHHFAWDFSYREASLFARIVDIRRDLFPKRVVYSTFSPRYNRAYWTQIDRIDRGLEMASIEATRNDEGLIEVTTGNLAAFSLLLSPEIAPEGKRLEVRVDGQRAFRGTPKSDKLSFARQGKGRWKASKSPWQGPAQGPPDHAETGLRAGSLVQYGAHVYVYGTSGDQAATAALKKGAERLADWGPDVRARWTVMPDTAVTPEIMATRNLVLLGDASVNAATARVQERLPIRRDSEGIWAGARRLTGPGGAYRLQYPSPLVPGRLLLIYGGDLEAMARFLPGRASRRPTLTGEYVVVDEKGATVLQGYYRDGYTIAASDD